MGRLFVTLQYLLPHHLLSRIALALTRSRACALKNALISAFVRHYRPAMQEALEPDPHRYESFNAFFTRALAPAARPLDADPHALLSPCDALLSMRGTLGAGQLLQAKGHPYSLAALLGAVGDWAEQLREGSYATLYLAPYDYHRIHMPLDGQLLAAWHIPGRLFSVNTATTARVPGLFARNERVVCLLQGERALFAVVLVGALFVGSMSTVWHGEITPWGDRAGGVGVHALRPLSGVTLWQPRGAELGRFNMGSTVLVLLPPGTTPHWQPSAQPGASVKVGQALARLSPP